MYYSTTHIQNKYPDIIEDTLEMDSIYKVEYLSFALQNEFQSKINPDSDQTPINPNVQKQGLMFGDRMKTRAFKKQKPVRLIGTITN